MKAPRIPSIFKLGNNQNKRFRYVPRTYDERKERLDQRMKEIENEAEYASRIKGSLNKDTRSRISDSWLRREVRQQEKNASRRVMLILAALAILVYLIFFKTDFLG